MKNFSRNCKKTVLRVDLKALNAAFDTLVCLENCRYEKNMKLLCVKIKQEKTNLRKSSLSA